MDRKILVVDDDAGVREMMVGVLEVLGGFRVITAQDGREGVERAVHERPDVILMDLEMPGMNGYEAARHLQARPGTANIPVIAVSGGSADRQLSDRMRGECVAYVAKPFEVAHLLAVIEGCWA